MENDELTTLSAVLRPGSCEIKRSYNYLIKKRKQKTTTLLSCPALNFDLIPK